MRTTYAQNCQCDENQVEFPHCESQDVKFVQSNSKYVIINSVRSSFHGEPIQNDDEWASSWQL